jgi:hypothetical protein
MKMKTWRSRNADFGGPPFTIMAFQSTKKPEVMVYSMLGKWRLAPRDKFLQRWVEAERPTA